MILNFYHSNTKDFPSFSVELKPNEDDFGLYPDNSRVNEIEAMNIYNRLRMSDFSYSISIKNANRYLLKPIKIKDLIRKYGLALFEWFPYTKSSMARSYSTSIITELLAMYMYYNFGYVYWTSNRHIYRIDNGVEIPQNSTEWNQIRDLTDVKICKTLQIGRTLQEYFKSNGMYVNGNVDFIYSSYDEGGLL